MLTDIEQVYRGFRRHHVYHRVKGRFNRAVGEQASTPEGAIAALDNFLLMEFFAFLKPFDTDLPDDSADNYYLEREWRKRGNLQFTPGDVMRVVVAAGFEDRLRTDAPDLGGLVSGL